MAEKKSRVKKQEVDDSSTPKNEDEIANVELSYLSSLLRIPVISVLELILHRSRSNVNQSDRHCLSQFRSKHPDAFALASLCDVFARGIFIFFAIIFIARGLDIEPVTIVLSAFDKILDFSANRGVFINSK